VNDDTLNRPLDEIAEAGVTFPFGALLVSQGSS
jgi:hypothetical protein